MQDKKARALEHIRWRSATCKTKNQYSACFMARMKADVWHFLQDGDPEVTSVSCLETITVDKLQEPNKNLEEAHGNAAATL